MEVGEGGHFGGVVLCWWFGVLDCLALTRWKLVDVVGEEYWSRGRGGI